MVSIHYIIVYIIGILPISTLFVNQSLTNKILFGLSVAAFLWAVIGKLDRKAFYLLLVLMAEFVISLIITGTLSLYNFNDIFYLPLWVLLFIYLRENVEEFNEALRSQVRFMKLCVYSWEILFVILRLAAPSMNEEYSHRSASAAFLIIAMVWYIGKLTGSKWFYLNLIVPLAAVFLLEVRTYLIVCLIVVLLAYYTLFENKRIFFITLIPVVVGVVCFVLQTSVGERFVNPVESYYGGIWASITNNRSYFWAADIRAFFRSAPFNKLFGSGYNYIYDVNYRAVATRIWGHNDLIHIAITNGITGLYVYIRAFLIFIREYVRSVRIDRRLLVTALVILIFCAFFDGLYHYVAALYAAPFLLSGARVQNEEVSTQRKMRDRNCNTY